MKTARRRLKEAPSREGMRQVSVWFPEAMLRDLALFRVKHGMAANEVVRRAVRGWLARHKRRERKRRERGKP